MLRKIIHIDEEKCDGCGLCATACHEGAIQIIDGKAKLVREDFCDGLGDCLPACPQEAITFEEREAPAYDAAAVEKHKNVQEDKIRALFAQAGCSGARAVQMEQEDGAAPSPEPSAEPERKSRLRQWPCQIKLLPVHAPFYKGADVLIAADCTAYAYANMHEEFMKGRITMIGCPKLDDGDYTEKLTQIIAMNDVRSVTIVRMEVPCCGGLQMASVNALRNSGKNLPWQVVTITRDGRILE